MEKTADRHSRAIDIVSDAGGVMAVDYVVVDVPPNEIRRLRTGLGMSQAEFAAAYGFPLRTLQDWEQGRRWPDASVRSYLKVIEKMPKQVRTALKKGASAKVREARRQRRSRASLSFS